MKEVNLEAVQYLIDMIFNFKTKHILEQIMSEILSFKVSD